MSLARRMTTPLAALLAGLARQVRRHAAIGARRLRRPVISVGNLGLGGAGKTPLVALLARHLRDAGERPAILSRGYAREIAADGVTVVSDGVRLRADLARSGDEPLWLARTLPGVAVLVSTDRFLAGVLAESRFGCTVHLLDDGFQHHRLARDVDLVIVTAGDLRDRVVPFGRLREPLDALACADAVVAPAAEAAAVLDALTALGRPAPPVFTMTRSLGVPRSVEPWGAPPRVPRTAPVMAVAGIARPEAFFAALERDGWALVARRAFADHHRYGLADLRAIADEAHRAGAALVLTTEKDLMRLLPLRPLPVPFAWVPLRLEVGPVSTFPLWLGDRLREARRRVERWQEPTPATPAVADPAP